jgi:hypothetical protein
VRSEATAAAGAYWVMLRRRSLALAATLTLAFVAQACSSDSTPSAATPDSAAVADPTTTGPTATDSTAVASTDVATTVPDTATPTTAATSATTNEPWAVVPDGADFYTPPADLAERAVGSVIWSEPADPIPGADVSKILYVSESLAGEPIAVSAMVAVPTQPAPPAGWPIISWAHGTTGSADVCAPSVGNQFSVPLPDQVVAAGYIAIATDYEGLGTPGLHPYLVADSEARSVLDAARAAMSIDGASSTVFTWGWSQGGQASIRAGELAPTYAPELDVRGAVGFAPLAQVSGLATFGASSSSLAGFWVPMIAGYAEAYPDTLDVADVLSPAIIDKLDLLETGCTDVYFPEFGAVGGAPGIVDPMTLEAWATALTGNDNGQQAMTMPLLVVQGSADGVVPQSLNDVFTADACAVGTTVQYTVRNGADHGSIVPLSIPEVLAWMNTLLTGTPAPSNCAG